jgi:hypothetical protein
LEIFRVDVATSADIRAHVAKLVAFTGGCRRMSLLSATSADIRRGGRRGGGAKREHPPESGGAFFLAGPSF